MTKDLDQRVARAMELQYERGFIDGMQKQMQSSVDMAVNRMAQTQEPVAEYIGENWDGSIVQLYEDLQKGTKLYTSPPQRTEQNFCSRCGKRTADLTVIHTCTPPQD
jgi:hypothetical protein